MTNPRYNALKKGADVVANKMPTELEGASQNVLPEPPTAPAPSKQALQKGAELINATLLSSKKAPEHINDHTHKPASPQR